MQVTIPDGLCVPPGSVITPASVHGIVSRAKAAQGKARSSQLQAVITSCQDLTADEPLPAPEYLLLQVRLFLGGRPLLHKNQTLHFCAAVLSVKSSAADATCSFLQIAFCMKLRHWQEQRLFRSGGQSLSVGAGSGSALLYISEQLVRGHVFVCV